MIPTYPGCVVPLKIFMARKFSIGFLGVKFWSGGIFLGFDFCPIQSYLSLEIWSNPQAGPQLLSQETKMNLENGTSSLEFPK